jgi:photosystem II stability/assembly factor-like uncharacterized protein
MHGRRKRVARWARVGIPAMLVAGVALGAPKKKDQAPTLTPQDSGTTNRLQAVSPVNSQVVWASGVGGTYAITTDGGAHWESHVVPGAEALQFRDVEGVSASVAYLLASGAGTDSRIYKTEDGGATWSLQAENTDPSGFWDCFGFWTPTKGLTMADSSNGRFPVLRTLDGETWQDIGDRLPTPVAGGEFAFAASGTCVATVGKRFAWIGTGGGAEARILATTDQGQTWNAYPTPVDQGSEGAGVFSVDFRNPRHGVLGGGDFESADIVDNFARSKDGGKTWTLTTNAPIPGAIFGLSYAGKPSGDDNGEDDDHGGGSHNKTVVATGPGGAAWTPDEGDTWHLLEGVDGYWAVAFANPDAGWLVGTDGRILKISF